MTDTGRVSPSAIPTPTGLPSLETCRFRLYTDVGSLPGQWVTLTGIIDS